MHPTPPAPPRHRSARALLGPLVLTLVGAGAAACGPGTSAPATPTAGFALPGNGAAAVTWVAPDQRGDITSYVATAAPGGRSCRSVGTTCTIVGLTNGKAYSIGVQSISAAGRSPSLTIAFRAGVPWPPSAVAGAPGDSSVGLTWKAPLFSTSPVTSYTVTSTPAGGSCTSTTTTCTVTGLTNDTLYSFAVTAHNQYGASAPSLRSATITPSSTAGGSADIVYLGPLKADPASTTGPALAQDTGISVALPNGHDLWIFGDSSLFIATTDQSGATTGSGRTGKTGKGHRPSVRAPSLLKDIKPFGVPVGTTTPLQIVPAPSDTRMPDGSGRACTRANGALYAARWPTGAALLDTQTLYVSYTDVCVTSPTAATVEGWGFVTYGLRGGRVRTQTFDVFPPATNGAALPPDRAYGSPVVANGQLTLFASQCTSLPAACTSGSVWTTTVSSGVAAMRVATNYVSHPAVTDGTVPWTPFGATVAAYPSGLRLIEQTSTNGTFTVFSSAAPTGPWTAGYSGTLPGCSTTPQGFCYSFIAHPELSTGTGMVVSYFKPDPPGTATGGRVYLAQVPSSGP